MSEVLLITPPFTQLNTPYPATAYIKGFLNTKDIDSFQVDLSLEVIRKIFSKQGLTDLFAIAETTDLHTVDDNIHRIYHLQQHYIQTVDAVISFLQGNYPSLAHLIVSRGYLPEAGRLDRGWSDGLLEFGPMGITDQAKHLATLYLEDLSDFIVDVIDPDFGFTRYAERISRSANSFDPLHDKLTGAPTYIDQITLPLLHKHLQEQEPAIVCITAPFPGNIYSAMRCGQYIKTCFPQIKVALGGGFANTELRSLKDARVFDYVDYITLDDGETPLEVLIMHLRKASTAPASVAILKRTWHLVDGQAHYNNLSLQRNYKMEEVGTPDYRDLPLDKYISFIEVANPMHKLWSDGRWNKLTMAHGCYWGKCTFCDISLDYIQSYEPVAAALLVDRVEEMIEQTGERGFHFVDEAAPPSLMKAFAIEVLRRNLSITWWTNIRFEQSFTPDLCQLLRASGCIAVSGGLEVASNRLLELIQKGVSVEQVAYVTKSFTDSGVMVHTYLMYGYPTQTIQETIDSLEMVRQMMALGYIQSGFWHQFALTAHSPVGMDPASYGIEPHYEEVHFAHNDVNFTDKTGIDHSRFAEGLRVSLYNYMHGEQFDAPLQQWFDFEVPSTTIPSHYIESSIYTSQLHDRPKIHARMIYLGALPSLIDDDGEYAVIGTYVHAGSIEIELPTEEAHWLLHKLAAARPTAEPLTLRSVQVDYESTGGVWEDLWDVIAPLRAHGGLIMV